jgi:hypothetical protein
MLGTTYLQVRERDKTALYERKAYGVLWLYQAAMRVVAWLDHNPKDASAA